MYWNWWKSICVGHDKTPNRNPEREFNFTRIFVAQSKLKTHSQSGKAFNLFLWISPIRFGVKGWVCLFLRVANNDCWNYVLKSLLRLLPWTSHSWFVKRYSLGIDKILRSCKINHTRAIKHMLNSIHYLPYFLPFHFTIFSENIHLIFLFSHYFCLNSIFSYFQ